MHTRAHTHAMASVLTHGIARIKIASRCEINDGDGFVLAAIELQTKASEHATLEIGCVNTGLSFLSIPLCLMEWTEPLLYKVHIERFVKGKCLPTRGIFLELCDTTGYQIEGTLHYEVVLYTREDPRWKAQCMVRSMVRYNHCSQITKLPAFYSGICIQPSNATVRIGVNGTTLYEYNAVQQIVFGKYPHQQRPCSKWRYLTVSGAEPWSWERSAYFDIGTFTNTSVTASEPVDIIVPNVKILYCDTLTVYSGPDMITQ